MVSIETRDCTCGVIEFQKGEMSNMEMLCSAPNGSKKHLEFSEERGVWFLTWELADVEVVRADSYARVNSATPIGDTVRELMRIG